MQQQNNEYFTSGKQHGNQAENFQSNDDDEFWYQTPKGVAHQSGYGAAYHH